MREEEEECELKLELSIGGIYGKSENQKQIEENITWKRPLEQYNLVDATGCKFGDMQKRKEIQAISNEEVSKRLRRMGNAGQDKVLLEGQQFQDGEIREKDWFCEDSTKKREKNNGTFSEIAKGLNLSLFRESKSSGAEVCRNSGSFRNGNSLKDDMGVGNAKTENGNWAAVSNGSIECSSSAVSNYQSMSPKEGTNCDSGGHSSSLSSLQNQSAPTKCDALKHLEGNSSSSPTEPEQCFPVDGNFCSTVVSSSIPRQCNWSNVNSKPDAHSGQTNNTGSTSEKPAPRPNQEAASFARMPCVSTTGNGPDGRTVNGFLYKYTRSEVCIMCVCHGKSFSPAQFVEHAGGIDVKHPMRHITMV